jgi:Kinesin motor domain
MQSKTDKQDLSYGRPLCSKLMLVDLAGSERVRRSVSQGARLAEAKSINSSLSALGNVISALAGLSDSAIQGLTHTHIPYRDSKLTKLLQDSLGGSAATALIATVGPAAVNHGETLSTLTFASRCMSVRCQHVVVLEGTVDYVSECLVLREEVNILEVELSRQQEITAAQTKIYDSAIRQLYCKLISSRKNALSAGVAADAEGLPEQFDFNKLDSLIESLSAAAATVPAVALHGDSVVWCKGVLSNFDTSSSQNPNWPVRGVVPSIPDADDMIRAQRLGITDLGPQSGIQIIAASRSDKASEREINSAHELLAASRFDLECAAVRHMELASMQEEDLKRRKNSLSLLRLRTNSSFARILGPSIPRSDSLEASTDPRSRSMSGPEKGLPKGKLHSTFTDMRFVDSFSELGSADMSADGSDFGMLRPSSRGIKDGERGAGLAQLRASSKTPRDSSIREERNLAPSSSSSSNVAYRPHRQHSAASHIEPGVGILGRNGGEDESQGGSERQPFDSREAGSLVDQIGSLSVAQLTLLSPEMREQVMVIRRMLENDVSKKGRRDSGPDIFSIEDGKADGYRDRDRDRDRERGGSGNRSDYRISNSKSNSIPVNEGIQSGQPSRLRIRYSHSYDSEGGRISERDD